MSEVELGKCARCGKPSDDFFCDRCLSHVQKSTRRFITNNQRFIRPIMMTLYTHLPETEKELFKMGQSEIALDPEIMRFVIYRGKDTYSWDYGCVVRLRNEELTYFKNGAAYTSPPPSEN